MTQNEIYQMQGEYEVLKRELETLEISGNNSVITINNILNPLNMDNSITDLEVKRAKVEMDQLFDTWEKTKEKKAKKEKIEAALKGLKKALL